MKRELAIVLLVSSLLIPFLFCPDTTIADTLDVSQTNYTTSPTWVVDSTYSQAQSFEVTEDYETITKVEILIKESAFGASDNLNIQLRNGSLDPADSITPSLGLQPSQISDSLSWVEVSWSSCDSVNSSDTLYLVLETSDSDGYLWAHNDSSTPNPYAGGASQYEEGGSWYEHTGYDNAFKVYADNAPSTPSEVSGITNGGPETSYDFSASTTDSEGDDLYYFFYWDWPDDTNYDIGGPVASGSTCTVSHTWSSTGTYDVRVFADDGDLASDASPEHLVDISNSAPNTPSLDSPVDGAAGVNINSSLSWSCSDPDGDSLTYDVYFDISTPPSKIIANQSSTSYDPYDTDDMAYGETYYWKIVAWDEHGASSSGSTWSFTTNCRPTSAVPYISDMPVAIDESVTISSVISDDDNDDVKANFSFGDGTYNITPDSWQPDGTNISTTHSWPDVDGASNGTFEYPVKAKGMDEHGANGSWSDIAWCRVYGIPNDPYSFDAIYYNESTDIVLPTQIHPTGNDTVDSYTDYNITWKQEGGTNTTYTISNSHENWTVNHTSVDIYTFTHYNRTLGKTYHYWINAYNDVGNSSKLYDSVETNYSLPEPPIIDLKTDGVSNNNSYQNDADTAFNITWSESYQYPYYHIYQNTGGGWTKMANTSNHYYSPNPNITSEGEYKWAVKSVDSYGNESQNLSNWVNSYIDRTDPSIDMAVTSNQSSLEIQWDVSELNFKNVTLNVFENSVGDLNATYTNKVYSDVANQTKTVTVSCSEFEYGTEYQITAMAYDKAGNQDLASSTGSIVISNASVPEPKIGQIRFHSNYLQKSKSTIVTISFDSSYTMSSKLTVKAGNTDISNAFSKVNSYLFDGVWTPQDSGEVDFYIQGVSIEGGTRTIELKVYVFKTPQVDVNPSVVMYDDEGEIYTGVFSKNRINASGYKDDEGVYFLSFGKTINGTIDIDATNLEPTLDKFYLLERWQIGHISWFDRNVLKLKISGLNGSRRIKYPMNANYDEMEHFDNWEAKWFSYQDYWEEADQTEDYMLVVGTKDEVTIKYTT